MAPLPTNQGQARPRGQVSPCNRRRGPSCSSPAPGQARPRVDTLSLWGRERVCGLSGMRVLACVHVCVHETLLTTTFVC